MPELWWHRIYEHRKKDLMKLRIQLPPDLAGFSEHREPIHGFPPDIAMHCPRPLGAEEEAEGQVGWGLQAATYEPRTEKGHTPPLELLPPMVTSPRIAPLLQNIAPTKYARGEARAPDGRLTCDTMRAVTGTKAGYSGDTPAAPGSGPGSNGCHAL